MMLLQPTVTCLCLVFLWNGITANVELTVQPSDVKVGDTVTIICSHSSPEKTYFTLIYIDRRKQGIKEEISKNGYLNNTLRLNGRYTSKVEAQNEGTVLIVKITISDVKLEDSGKIECLIPSEGSIAEKDLTVTDGVHLELTVLPSDAKAGDTVTITCSHSSPENAYFMLIDRRKEGMKEEISKNGFLNNTLSLTGRYSGRAEVQNEGKDFVVKITISDSKVEDSGKIECLIPSEGRSAEKDLTVTDDKVTYNLELRVTPRSAQVGDTVTVTCSLTTPSHGGSVTISRKEKDFRITRIVTNGFLNPEFQATGRYKSDVKIKEIDDGQPSKGMQLIMTLTIKDATQDDFGEIWCMDPAERTIVTEKIQVAPN